MEAVPKRLGNPRNTRQVSNALRKHRKEKPFRRANKYHTRIWQRGRFSLPIFDFLGVCFASWAVPSIAVAQCPTESRSQCCTGRAPPPIATPPPPLPGIALKYPTARLRGVGWGLSQNTTPLTQKRSKALLEPFIWAPLYFACRLRQLLSFDIFLVSAGANQCLVPCPINSSAKCRGPCYLQPIKSPSSREQGSRASCASALPRPGPKSGG